MHNSRQPITHRGFTLIELLVVMTIILALGAIAAAFIPTGIEKQRVSRGAGDLQGWLQLAKQWALRDQAPRGVRLQPVQATDSTTAVTAPGSTQITPTAMSGLTVDGIPWQIQVNSVLLVSDPNGLNAESVIVTAVTATTFTATFSYKHGTAPFPIRIGYVHTAQYIEQPDDWSQGGTLSATAGAAQPDGTQYFALTATAGTGDFFGGFGVSSDPGVWPVQAGDLLQITPPTNGNVYRIVDHGTPTAAPLTLTVAGDPSWTDFPTSNYVIVRAPRVRPSEGALQLPQNVAIDLLATAYYTSQANTAQGLSLPLVPGTGNIDILFNPNGSISYWAGSGDKIHLWLRDMSVDATSNPSTLFNGEQALVSVYIRTGMIGYNPVDITLATSGTQYANPFYFTLDGRSSGQ